MFVNAMFKHSFAKCWPLSWLQQVTQPLQWVFYSQVTITLATDVEEEEEEEQQQQQQPEQDQYQEQNGFLTTTKSLPPTASNQQHIV